MAKQAMNVVDIEEILLGQRKMLKNRFNFLLFVCKMYHQFVIGIVMWKEGKKDDF